jgi:hypothetical protein
MSELKELIETKPDYRTPEGIAKHPLMRTLTKPMQAFVVEFCKNGGDGLAAVHAAYGEGRKKPLTHNGAVSLKYRILHVPTVQKLLAIFYDYEVSVGKMTKAEFLGLVTERLRDKELGAAAFVQLANIVVQVTGWQAQKPNPRYEIPKQKEKSRTVDEMVAEMEKQDV